MALERKWSGIYGQGDVHGIAALLAKDSILLAPEHRPNGTAWRPFADESDSNF